MAADTGVKVVANDYNQHFLDTGERPQNFIRDHEPHLRFSEYPRLERLIKIKDELQKSTAHLPMQLKVDLKQFDLTTLGHKFDVILIDPPWKEYSTRGAAILGAPCDEDLTPWTVDEMLAHLPVDRIAETPAFCFLWCGSEHLDDGRRLLQAWGFRRCEDVCWLKTNLNQRHQKTVADVNPKGLFHHTKEHCLMGVRGSVKRNTDSHLIHTNIDTDVIVSEQPFDLEGRPTASTQKPGEIYDIIERFCLGRKKIELFGLDRNIRPGWLTLGRDISISTWDPQKYANWMSESAPGTTGFRGRYTGTTPEIESLRPKSPPRV